MSGLQLQHTLNNTFGIIRTCKNVTRALTRICTCLMLGAAYIGAMITAGCVLAFLV
jgi:hypothetical protein